MTDELKRIINDLQRGSNRLNVIQDTVLEAIQTFTKSVNDLVQYTNALEERLYPTVNQASANGPDATPVDLPKAE